MKNNLNSEKEIGKLKQVKQDEEFLTSLRKKLVMYMEENPVIEIEKKPSVFYIFKNKLAVVAAVIVVMILGGTGVFAASQKSLPGSALYPVKIFAENVSLSLTPSQEAKISKNFQFATNRINEIKTLAQENQIAAQAISPALNNLNNQLKQVQAQADQLKKGGQLEQSLETNSKLSAAISNYQNQLQPIAQKNDNEISQEINNTFGGFNNIRQEIETATQQTTQQELQNAVKVGIENAAKQKINSAQNHVDEIKKNLVPNQNPVNSTSSTSSQQTQNENNQSQQINFNNQDQNNNNDPTTQLLERSSMAQQLLNSAKTNYENKNYEQSFNSAQESINSAAQAQMLIDLNQNESDHHSQEQWQQNQQQNNQENNTSSSTDHQRSGGGD